MTVWSLGGIGAVLLLVLLAARLLVMTDAGRGWLVSRIESAVNGPGQTLEIGTLTGDPLSGFHIGNVRMSDGQGQWLSVRSVDVKWSPWPLLAGTLDMDSLTVDGVMLSRLPQAGSEPEEPSPPGLPRLPVDIVLGRFEIGNVAVSEAAVGTDAVLAARGNVRIVRGEGYSLDLSGRRTDRDEGSLRARLRYDPGADVLDVGVNLDARAGGVLTNLLGVPGRPGLALNISGDGPLSGWNGQMTFRAGEQSVVDLKIAATRNERTNINLSGSIDPRPLAQLPMLDAAFDVSGRLHVQGGVLEIESLALDGPPSSLRLFGTVDSERSAMDLIFQVHPEDMARLNALTAPAILGETAVDGRLSGPFDNPNLSLNILSDRIEVEGARADGIFLTVMARRDGDGIMLSGTGGVNSLSYGDTELSGMPSLLVDARLPGDWSAIDLQRAELRATDGSVSASGTIPLSGGPLDVKVEADIPAGGQEGDSLVSRLLAPGLTASASIAQAGPDSPLAISDIALQHPWVTASGKAGFAQGEGAELGRFDVHVTDVDALAGALGAPLSGEEITITATVGNDWARPRLRGHVQSPHLVAGGTAIDHLDIQVENDPAEGGGQGGHVDLTAGTPLGETALALVYTVPNEGPVDLSSVSLNTPMGMLTGAFIVPRDGTPVTGSLGGRVTAGPELKDQTGLPLEGDVDLMLELRNELGTQGLAFSAGGENVFVGPVKLASLQVEALQTADTIDFSLDSRGSFQGDAQLTAQGSLSSSGDRQTLLMRAFNLTTGMHKLQLSEPVRITKVPERVEIQPLTLALDDGTMAVALRQTAGEMNLDLKLESIPLGLADLADIPLGVGGRLSGTVDFSAQGQTARGDVALKVEQVELSGGTARIRGLNGTLDGTWDGQRLSLKSDIKGQGGEAVAVTAALPLVYQPESGAVTMPPDGPLMVDGTWKADVAPLWQVVGSDADFLAGALDATFSVTGTVSAPEPNGQFRLRNGSYRNVDFGTALKDVTADLSLMPHRATIDDVSATDGKGGTLTATGVVDFPAGAPPTVDMTVMFDKLRAMARPDVTATVSGNLEYTLDDQQSLLKGMVTTNEVEARLINSMSSDVVSLDVVEVPEPLDQTQQTTTEEQGSPPMMLDIDVHIPRKLFIRGRGLDSEWKGDLKVAGPADAFTLTGGVNVERGNFTFAGKRFELTTGDVRFNGNNPVNPDVNIRAEYDTSDITAIVSIGGTAQDIKISFSSNPALPEDEVVSNILFEKGVTNLSALEAVQLASAMRSLSSGGEGLVGSARSALGLDVLSFGAAENGQGTVVRGGKYITRNVYLEVQSGTEPGSEKIGVEVEVTNNLSVESHVSETVGGDIGVYWKRDY
jgi:translocation and assembly module TamB